MRHVTGKALALVLALCAGSGAPGVAEAQVSFGVAAGYSVPTGALADVTDNGFHAGVTAELGLPLLPVGLRGDVLVQRLPGSGGQPDVDHLFATLNGTLGLLPLPLASIYLTGGLGLYTGDQSPEVGINAGVGAGLNLLVVRPFLEARYHTTLGQDRDAFIPITLGIRF